MPEAAARAGGARVPRPARGAAGVCVGAAGVEGGSGLRHEVSALSQPCVNTGRPGSLRARMQRRRQAKAAMGKEGL